ncbi:type III secretion system protein [Candidatus Chlamydia sanziniae]|uniref:Flagellar M-Ring Protein n=1 Tax=Candidatus Chlamydia sanziniae TaxID=1806891 RepID=A0A1A9HUY7_9CHLA|nr:type III secretion system protein [Candidatus Chlamydia sanziniae]ANH78655.1 Flagellar M-Ring Protein [Candidatus Chlamydia sanziniae]
MFFQNLKKKLAALGVSPLGFFLVVGAISCAMLFSKSSSTSKSLTPTKVEKTSNHWLKFSQTGNLRFMEALAKKEQLERDLTTFDSIMAAKVALALPLEEETENLLKLSVILTPQKDAFLTPSLLFSITDYLCSSVPGLHKENITLSDNLGNFYSPEPRSMNSLFFTTLENYLKKIFPKEHFAFSYLPSEEKPIVQFTINENYVNSLPKEESDKVINHAIHYLHQNCSDFCTIITERLPFAYQHRQHSGVSKFLIGCVILLSSLSIVALASLYLGWHAYERVSPEPKKIKRGINITKLVEIIQKEPPEKIALILSYLDPKKAEILLSRLPENLRNRVLKYKL